MTRRTVNIDDDLNTVIKKTLGYTYINYPMLDTSYTHVLNMFLMLGMGKYLDMDEVFNIEVFMSAYFEDNNKFEKLKKQLVDSLDLKIELAFKRIAHNKEQGGA